MSLAVLPLTWLFPGNDRNPNPTSSRAEIPAVGAGLDGADRMGGGWEGGMMLWWLGCYILGSQSLLCCLWPFALNAVTLSCSACRLSVWVVGERAHCWKDKAELQRTQRQCPLSGGGRFRIWLSRWQMVMVMLDPLLPSSTSSPALDDPEEMWCLLLGHLLQGFAGGSTTGRASDS